jgi:membrane associated rhomboid family serine protease
MDYELALISVVVAAGYWGWFFTRRRPHGTATFGVMCIIAAALSCLGLLGRHVDVPVLGIAGAVGVGAGACLLVLGPLARGLARWLAGKERYGAAQRLLDIADVLAPGSGVADEKAMLGAMREIRDGKIESTVGALEAAKHSAPAEARLAIDERIAMLYLAAYRWSDAIAHAEAHLFGAIPEAVDDTGEAGVPLRRALGLAPPVWVELLGAYGRTGDLDRAATMLARLEDVAAGREDAAVWLHRARLMFLALAGRPDAVRTLVAPKRARHMSAAARTYWVAVAHEKRGDSDLAGAAYAKARGRSRGKPRDLIDEALARLADRSAMPAELGEVATQVIARVEAAPPPAIAPRRTQRGPWATNALTVSLVVVAIVIATAIGPSTDIGVLLRAGAMFRDYIDHGENWRLVSCIFIHIGGLHLILNTTGLWVLGRITEDMFGPARMLAIFAVAGIAGSTTSYLASGAASAGASGAVFGLLGAVFVEITWHRARYRQAWKRGMWGGLVVVTLAQLGYGFLYPVVDQWAHGAGLAAGALIGALLSPHARWAKPARHLARGIAVAFVLAALAAGALVITTPVSDSFARLPHEVMMVRGVTVDVPTPWHISRSDGEVFERDLFVLFRLDRIPGPIGPVLVARIQSEPDHVREYGFDQIDVASDGIVDLPPGWESRELVVSQVDPLGSRQEYRVVIAAKQIDGETLVASVYLPESIARMAPDFVRGVLAPAR